jgi:hypothetical protein
MTSVVLFGLVFITILSYTVWHILDSKNEIEQDCNTNETKSHTTDLYTV